LLQYPTIEKAAHAVGVHPTTLRRWLKQPKFQEKYGAAMDEIYQHAKGRMLQGSQAAVATVFRIMTDLSVAPGTRLQAAKCVLGSRERSERAERPSQHGSPGTEGTMSVAECLLARRRRRRALEANHPQAASLQPKQD
jgi:transposase-like protein